MRGVVNKYILQLNFSTKLCWFHISFLLTVFVLKVSKIQLLTWIENFSTAIWLFLLLPGLNVKF